MRGRCGLARRLIGIAAELTEPFFFSTRQNGEPSALLPIKSSEARLTAAHGGEFSGHADRIRHANRNVRRAWWKW